MYKYSLIIYNQSIINYMLKYEVKKKLRGQGKLRLVEDS